MGAEEAEVAVVEAKTVLIVVASITTTMIMVVEVTMRVGVVDEEGEAVVAEEADVGVVLAGMMMEMVSGVVGAAMMETRAVDEVAEAEGVEAGVAVAAMNGAKRAVSSNAIPFF